MCRNAGRHYLPHELSFIVEKQPRRILDKNIEVQEKQLMRSSYSPLEKGALPSSAGGMLKSSGPTDSATSMPRRQAGFKKGGIEEPRNKWVDIPAERGASQKLSDAQILKLSELVLKIEEHYCFPCDIEWAFAKGGFYITQSRPITTLQGVASVKLYPIRCDPAKWQFWGKWNHRHAF